jgi:acetyltransferase-like isoleucine patch superfamily enzyme
MTYYTTAELNTLGFKILGSNIKISKKAAIYEHNQIEIGDNSRIDDFCVISGKVSIGKNVHIAVFCNVAGGEVGVTLHDFSGLAYGVHVMAKSDDYSGKSMTNPTVPAEFKNERSYPVIIGRHVIVGTGSVVLPGVELAEGSAVGAMSLVTKSTMAWTIYGGIPAKPLKDRSRELLNLETQYSQKF